MKRGFRRAAAALGAVLCALALLSCAPVPNGGAQSALRVCLVEDLDGVDPQNGLNTGNMALSSLLYEGLMRPAPDGGWTYGVAESYTVSQDGLVYVYRLRKDAVWSDGTPVRAQDFVYAWNRLLDRGLEQSHGTDLAYWLRGGWDRLNGGEGELGVRAVDEKTLEVTLESPCPYMDALMSRVTLTPLRQGQEALTNGPFRLEGEEEGVMHLVRSEVYWDRENVLPGRIDVCGYETPEQALAAMRAGELDFSLVFPLQEGETLREEGLYADAVQAGNWYVDFQRLEPPFDDPLVRKAFALAIDPQEAVEAMSVAADPAGALVPPCIWPGEDRLYAQDTLARRQQARQALAQAGYPGGTGFAPVEMIVSEIDVDSGLADALCAQWEETLGVRVTLEVCGVWEALVRRSEGRFQLSRGTCLNDYMDPVAMVRGDWVWYAYYDENASFAREADRASQAADEEERRQALRRAEALLIDNWACIPVYYFRQPYLVRPGLCGVCITPGGDVLLTGAHFA